MRPALIILLLLSAPIATADETVTVYQLNGTRQCMEGHGVAAQQAADLLRAQGVKVIAAEQRQLPLEFAERCGAPTGKANVIEVSAADWSVFTAQNPDAAGYGVWIFDQPEVQVYKYDGTLQCGIAEGLTLEAMAKELTGAGIQVLASRSDTDGFSHVAVCGASTGAINVYTIKTQDLVAARVLGFRVLVSGAMTQEVKPRIKRAAGIQARPLPKPLARPADGIPLLW